MLLTRIATTQREMDDLVGAMVEVDHPDLDLSGARLTEERNLVIPAVVPDSAPAFEWEAPVQSDTGFLHSLWVHRRDLAALVIASVEQTELSLPDLDSPGTQLQEITYDGRNVVITGGFGGLARATVGELRVALEVSGEVADILTIHQLPSGVQSRQEFSVVDTDPLALSSEPGSRIEGRLGLLPDSVMLGMPSRASIRSFGPTQH